MVQKWVGTVHTDGKEVKRANSDVAKGLEAQILITKGCRIMLASNISGLVNGFIGIVQDILFEEQGPLTLHTTVYQV